MGDHVVSMPRFRIAQQREPSHLIPQRLISKDGVSRNITSENASEGRGFFAHILYVVPLLSWASLLLAAAALHILSWICFAALWWMVLKQKHLGITSYLLISATGVVSEEHLVDDKHCDWLLAMIPLLQSIWYKFTKITLVFIVLSKVSRTAAQPQGGFIFSDKAVVSRWRGKFCFVFRIGDSRASSHIVAAQLKAYLVQRRVSEEGEIFPYRHQLLPLGVRGYPACPPLVVWPWTAVHVIDSQSPLYTLSPDELATCNLEVIVCLSGRLELTGEKIAARASYRPREIKWGHRFKRALVYRRTQARFEADYACFNETVSARIPRCSAQRITGMENRRKQRENSETSADS